MPSDALEWTAARLAAEPAVLVRVERVQGSAPREPGAWMAVFAGDVAGTVGGGHVELQAMASARRMLAGEDAPALQRYALGPSLGQCCGGVMHLRFERLGPGQAADLAQRLAAPRAPLALFGGGHVGRAIAQAVAPLPYALTWIDSRDNIFPAPAPDGVQCEHSDPVEAAVPLLPAGSRVLVMSFSHAEDLDIVAACLRRLRVQGDLPFVGLIGSATKWATFRSRLRARGFAEEELARITCPIGIPGIRGKQPEVIAASVAAQLLLAAPP
ncbi:MULTISPECIES: xanthine dehydrogenase accessory protein XdhC [Ramlibacter]|uniref:Xanthine dehydrogenase accessory protein XdhC n=1 Tax=Ramlibacter aquaticus TaxID=2780094 RepID=A0ABR9SJC7_9BURK|nr:MULTISPECIES: xanthine dehydrogenase accessory protein XdhC [Ramlibacter]MBE7942127.1 xanthine dehydrogenase accessory protein XdhC [Ramlibacter aquaticus]